MYGFCGKLVCLYNGVNVADIKKDISLQRYMSIFHTLRILKVLQHRPIWSVIPPVFHKIFKLEMNVMKPFKSVIY